MRVSELLSEIDLGSSVAEFDESLEKHFIETDSFRALISGKYDIIAGDKGTGKTALYRALVRKHRSLPELANNEIISAFNPAGNPVFQRLTHTPPLSEGQYASVWKTFFLSLVGNWLLELFSNSPSDSMRKLDELLRRVGLRSPDDSASTVFSKLINTFSHLLRPKTAEVALTISEQGIPVMTPRVEFNTDRKPPEIRDIIPHEDALRLLDKCLAELETDVWIIMDRLDESFQGYPDTERPALRALLRTYLDLLEFPRLQLKLFVRHDLFRKVIQGGFVNLTHVNARRLNIVWDEEDLLHLLSKRIRGSASLVQMLGLANASDRSVFNVVFPSQINVGERKPTSWNWMMSRIRDGNNVKPPRNLIDLAKKAQSAQQRSEERAPRDYSSGAPLIEADAVRRALRQLSEDRVQDTLLAEAADMADIIERFRDGKAEHNVESLSRMLGIAPSDVRTQVKPLVEMGFLEEIGESFKVPYVYRDGLSITQGKAFSIDHNSDEEDDA